MDLSKAFDTVYYSFLIVKLNVYGFFTDSLKLNFIYLKNRKQWSLRTHGFREEVIPGVPQGSILGSYLFHIFINDMFLLRKTCNEANYANDHTYLQLEIALKLLLRSWPNLFPALVS